MALRRGNKRTARSKIDATPPWETRKPAEIAETTGPYDVLHQPDDEVERLDLGALRIPVGEFQLSVEVAPGGQVVAVSLVDADGGSMQLGVFAAPRSDGIWSDVRAEAQQSVSAEGGSLSDDPDGEFGPELSGKIPAATGFAPVRFLGIDGPRWFLRATLVGQPATDPARAQPFLDALRATVVVRGSDPLPVGEAVPLVLPPEIAAQLQQAPPA